MKITAYKNWFPNFSSPVSENGHYFVFIIVTASSTIRCNITTLVDLWSHKFHKISIICKTNVNICTWVTLFKL